MLQSWKLILTNWINCYSKKSGDEEQCLNIDSLVTIISHLRDNLNLDESKSSLLEAHTVEEFICEKYPEFKFENRTVAASNDEEVYLCASLLLFFVCVNSKNLAIKTAMCSKLSADDQEIILKFSKCLMGCPVITVSEVQAAITEACGQDIAAMELPRQYMVAETPPALRSMHCNIRRLQAELEAERFDRNYLQEELSRTNNRLERLLKEKEHHKLEILNLKAKISLCCGDEGVAKNTEMGSDVSKKLTRQLQQLELQLEETQAQLQDVTYERDTYKAKIEELKNERDKWLALTQQENARVSQLSEELDTERQHNQSLKDLVAELRQHNKLNGLDTSSLECDDPDASIHSLPHNSSICSEVCANVVEVQLGEERVKLAILQQQILTLQIQMNELNQMRENEKYALENVISQKDNEICNLKHRINEEIENQNHLKVHCDNERTKLNNELNELEQKLKENHENSRTLLEEKMIEIQTLQENKLSLLENLSDETMKLQTEINDLQRKLDSERQTRSRMKESYENQLMKLNEKVLNRSNEVVELQNSVFIKAEEIETLQIEIRNEREALQKLTSEFENMKEQNNILQKELTKEQKAFKELMNENQNLNAQKNSLLFEIEKQIEAFEGLMNKFQIVNEEKEAVEKSVAREQNIHKDIMNKYQDLENNLKTVKDAGKKIQNKYHSIHDHHKTLKAAHAKDTEMYNDLKNKYQKLEDHNNTMIKELNANNNAFEELKGSYDNICQQYNTIESILVKEKEKACQLDKNRQILEEENITYRNELQKKKDSFKELMQNYQNLIEHKNEIENYLKVKCEEEQDIKLDLETKVMSLKDQLTESENLAEKLKASYEYQIENLNVMVTKLSNYLKEKTAEIETLKADKDMLKKNVEVSSTVVKRLQEDLKAEKHIIDKITSDFESERQVLKNMVTVTESVMEDNKLALTNEITELSEAKHALELDYCKLQVSLKDLEIKYQTVETVNASFRALIKLAKEGKKEVEKESEMVRDYLDQIIKELNFERNEKATLIHSIETQKQAFTEDIENLKKDLDEQRHINHTLEGETNNLKKDLDELRNINHKLQNETEILKKDLHEMQNNSHMIEDERNLLKEELKSAEEKLQKLCNEKCEIEESYKDAINNLKVAQENVIELKKKIDYVTDENNNMKEKEYESLVKFEEMNAAINTLETELQSQKKKVDILMEKKTQAEQEVQKLQENLLHTLEKKSQAEINLNEKIENVAATQQKLKELKSRITDLAAENDAFKIEKGESDADLKELLKELQVDYNELQKQQDVLPQQIAELMNEFLMVANGETTLSQKKMYAYIKSVLKEKTGNLVAVQLGKKELESKVAALSNENNDLKVENNKTLSKLSDCKVKETELNKELDVLQCLNKNLTVAMEAIEIELHAKKEKIVKIEEKNLLLERALEENVEFLDKAQKEIKKLERNISELTDLVNNLNKEKEDSVAKIVELKTKVIDFEAVQKENQELKSTINSLASELENEKAKLHTVLVQKSETESDLNVRTNLVAKMSEEKTQVDKALEEKIAQEKSHSAMITKLTNYLKDKTAELEILRKDKDKLQQTVGDNCKVIKTLEENLKVEKQNIDKLTNDFESERQVLMNMVAATESVMEDTKLSFKNEISQHVLAQDSLEVEKKRLQTLLKDLEMQNKSYAMANASLISLLNLVRKAKHDVEKESEIVREYLDEVISYLGKERNTNISVISALEFQEKAMAGDYEKMKNDLEVMQTTNHDLKIALKTVEDDFKIKEEKLKNLLKENCQIENNLQERDNQIAQLLESKTLMEKVINEKTQNINEFQLEIRELKNKMTELFNERNNLELMQKDSITKLEEFKAKLDSSETKYKEEIAKFNSEKQQLLSTIDDNRSVITNLEQLIKHELEENHQLRDEFEQEKLVMTNRCTLLQDYQTKAEKVLGERQQENDILQKEVQTLQSEVELCKQDCKAKDGLISKMSKEKDAVIGTISKELVEEKALREKLEKEFETQKSIEKELRNNMEIRALKKENEQLIRAIGQQETFTAFSQEKVAEKYVCYQEHRDSNQVDSTSSDNSSVESLKTISDLEKIIHDKNRIITTLQTDIVYLKTLIAESETKLLDVANELEISKDNTQQLSNQLKKIVNQKNEEIADLKKQVSKMSATENRATQIIKVSAKYQAMILKRIAEIKSNTVLKELTNFGNSENELRRSLNAGSVTMEDLENFLETTDRHLKRCAEKQLALQKERDRLTEVNRIHESEIINLKKFLTELSVSFQTFSSVKDLYAHKLSRVISVQRTVRREILSLDGRVSDATMCKLERGYGAIMQDLTECTMNLERWVERCISRTVSVEKIKQAFTSDTERTSLSSPSFQNTGLEIQLEELEKSFQKLLEEIARAVKNEGASESQASTVMEVRAEYEDKLNRMKAKMKDLFNEQMALLKKKQREEIEILERELEKARGRIEDSKRAYESHIKELTKELWRVGEKYLVKNDEAEWLKKKQRSGSLMSLQHVHSSGLVPAPEAQSRPSDSHSLRSLQISESYQKKKRDGRGLHMSDEEGEVFDNRCLKELAMTPHRQPPGQRLSELKWRNSLCPPHLKSSYPAETQFAPVLDEEDLKASGSAIGVARGQRKEVGITAYKKPGPPTPSKQAGRLSATDSELRESLRVENDPHAHTERKTSTPARFRAFLRLNKHDSSDGTPRKRLSSIFRKK